MVIFFQVTTLTLGVFKPILNFLWFKSADQLVSFHTQKNPSELKGLTTSLKRIIVLSNHWSWNNNKTVNTGRRLCSVPVNITNTAETLAFVHNSLFMYSSNDIYHIYTFQMW